MTYPERLARELAAAGIPSASRRRIVAEIEDHLACDPGAQLGEPAALARQFAEELGTRRTLRAAFSAFVALAAAGVLFLVAVLVVQSAGGFARRIGQDASLLGTIGLALSVVGAQVALVAGTLCCLRALRRRRVRVLSRAEALVLVRRALVGLVAGLATLVGLALSAIALQVHIAGSWRTLALACAGAGTLALTGALPALVSARRLQPTAQGPAGDLGDDLRGLLPARVNAGSWGFALLVAGALALAIALAGVAKDDPFDGLARGLLDGAACLAGYLALGGYLGLRKRSTH